MNNVLIVVSQSDHEYRSIICTSGRRYIARRRPRPNQLRDDVERIIDNLYSDPDLRIILKDGARVYQRAMLASETEDSLDDERVSEETGRYVACVYRYYPDDSWEEAHESVTTLRKTVLNTPTRREAYRRYSLGRHGTVMGLSNITLEECLTDGILVW